MRQPDESSLEELTSDGKGSGVEAEPSEIGIAAPFNPALIDVITQARTIDLLLTRLKVDSPFKHPFAFTSRNADNICSVNYTHLHAQTVPIPGFQRPVAFYEFEGLQLSEQHAGVHVPERVWGIGEALAETGDETEFEPRIGAETECCGRKKRNELGRAGVRVRVVGMVDGVARASTSTQTKVVPPLDLLSDRQYAGAVAIVVLDPIAG
jgi:hypothetical protein